jgi:hypothetical protein
MDRRLALVPLLAVLALPAGASAASVKIGPKPSVISASSATIAVANPTRFVLRGTATVTAGSGAKAASRRVRLGRRSVSDVPLRFGRAGVEAVRAARGRATVKLALEGAGGKSLTARRTMTLRFPAGDQSPAPGGDPAPGGQPSPGGGPTSKPSSDTWVGRMGTEGAYDDLELTLIDGRITFTKTPLVPVYCFEMGGQYRTALSFEPFVVSGPWTLGQDAIVEQSGMAVNQLVSAGTRGISYKAVETARSGDTVTGKLGMSYFDSKYDIFTNRIWFVNCSGSQSFEAVPAP